MATMKAIRIHQYGGPEVLQYEDAPLPEMGTEDVLIRVHAAGVNPVDWKVREGYLRQRIAHGLPLILGWDLSGVVVDTGTAVSQLTVGAAVYGRPDIARNGTYAQYVAVRADELALKPESLDHVHAAAVPLACLTAWQALFEAVPPYTSVDLRAGQTILIHGAAGGVGSFAVQLAKWRGARVVATASAHNEAFLRGLGADEVIDYTARQFETAVARVDAVFDTVGRETQRRSWPVSDLDHSVSRRHSSRVAS